MKIAYGSPQSLNNLHPNFGAVPSYKVIDMTHWSGKNVFDRFSALKNPFGNETEKMDVTNLIQFAKEKRVPPNVLVMYAIGKAINAVSQLRIRMIEGKLVEFDKSCLSFPVQARGKEDEINFCEVDFNPDLDTFVKNIKTATAQAKKREGVFPSEYRPDAVYMSYVDRHYDSLTNPNNGQSDLIPRINWGKTKTVEEGKTIMPITLDMNHALGTGAHLVKFLQIFEEVCANAKADSLLEKAKRHKYFSSKN